MILTVTLNASVDKLYVLDRLSPYTVMRVKEVNNTAGGKGLNVSRVAAQAGERVIAMGFVGGYNGMLFESLIKEDGIEKHFTHTRSETRCCVNIWDTQTNQSTEFLEPGNPVTPQEVRQFLADFEKQLPRADVVAISGSMPKGVPADFYGELVQAARRQKKPVILDTSGDALKNSLSSRPTMIKPNFEEMQQLLNEKIGSRQELIAAAKKLQQSGIAIVAVSLGKDGVLVACGDDVYRGVAPKISAVNTVGCGDSMVAGFAVSMARQKTIEESIRYAVAISAANALTKETGSFIQEDFERLLEKTQVKKL